MCKSTIDVPFSKSYAMSQISIGWWDESQPRMHGFRKMHGFRSDLEQHHNGWIWGRVRRSPFLYIFIITYMLDVFVNRICYIYIYLYICCIYIISKYIYIYTDIYIYIYVFNWLSHIYIYISQFSQVNHPMEKAPQRCQRRTRSDPETVDAGAHAGGAGLAAAQATCDRNEWGVMIFMGNMRFI